MKNNNLYAVILVGGSGTRFWPLSRKDNPKQFLKIFGKETLFQKTLKRIRGVVGTKNTYLVSNQAYKKHLAGSGVPLRNILLEPQKKNTAAAICWAALEIYKSDPDAVLAVLPSDHLVVKEKNFHQVLNRAVDAAKKDHLVTLGIVPTRPDTGFGYLKVGSSKGGVLKVQQFIEKPKLAKAKQFLRSKNYFWNSGMFIFKAATILAEFKRYQPKIYRLLSENAKVNWSKLPEISIDYGIMEHSKKVVAVAAKDIGWSDVGSWDSLCEVLPKGKGGNIFRGDVRNIDSRNILAWGNNRPIAAIGLKDLIIVDTKEALLICQRGSSQAVKNVKKI